MQKKLRKLGMVTDERLDNPKNYRKPKAAAVRLA
jgi:hypothetical protein